MALEQESNLRRVLLSLLHWNSFGNNNNINNWVWIPSWYNKATVSIHLLACQVLRLFIIVTCILWMSVHFKMASSLPQLKVSGQLVHSEPLPGSYFPTCGIMLWSGCHWNPFVTRCVVCLFIVFSINIWVVTFYYFDDWNGVDFESLACWMFCIRVNECARVVLLLWVFRSKGCVRLVRSLSGVDSFAAADSL